MNKKVIIIIISVIVFIGLLIGGISLYKYIRIKTAVVKIELKDDLNVEFLSNVKVSDFIESINGKIVKDYKINTKKLGKKVIKYEYINEDNIKLKEEYTLNIVDTVAPLVWLGSSYSVMVGSEDKLLDNILCGDNYDNNPKCEIIGDYDLNTADSYDLVFKATDKSGNITEKKFVLNVKEPKKNNSSNNNNNNVNPPVKTLFSDIVKNYKTKDTEIGIDISEWQGVVDFNKLKEAGVEFVFIRVGGTKGINGEYFLDSKFVDNIKGANEANIPVGIYFYSYANSKESAIKDAKWILKQIKDYKVDLPIAFDWENWSFYNEFNLSFFGLTDMANSFLNVFKSKSYQGLLYSSKTYLDNIWLETDYPIWLAHYVSNTSYKGNYKYWQICNDGKVSGIDTDVDINIRYK